MTLLLKVKATLKFLAKITFSNVYTLAEQSLGNVLIMKKQRIIENKAEKFL